MKPHDLGPAVPLVIALAFQGWVTYRVWRSRVFERAQKFNQAKLIWLLPVLGAIMVFSVLSQEERAEREGPQLRL
jgi:tellurite resistance protein TehA-like permease